MGVRENLFSIRVWELAISIPPGRVTTYGVLAKTAGGGGQAVRSITGILGQAPNQKAIPYHRIVYTSGKIWLPTGHEIERLNKYKREKIDVDSKGKIKNFEEMIYYFD